MERTLLCTIDIVELQHLQLMGDGGQLVYEALYPTVVELNPTQVERPQGEIRAHANHQGQA
eukprot:5555335-Pyramimonas_sp.AAC.1